METVLIVDDDPLARLLISSLLEEEGYRLLMSVDGDDAQHVIEREGGAISAVLLDWQMPKMNGLELLRWIKKQPALENTPVIMQTAMSGSAFIQEGIDAGAFYYLTKPIDQKVLPAIVRAAVGDFSFKESMLRKLRESQNPFSLIQEGLFQFRTLDEAERLAMWIANACPVPSRAMGINEIFLNAVEHGNLGMTYEEKTQYLAEGRWAGEVDRRLALPQHSGKYVNVRIERHAGSMTVFVEDQGPGFDFARYLHFDEHRVFDTHGRGIAMAGATMHLEYLGKGNAVLVTIPFNAEDGHRERT